jgi:hypothetical protein
MDYLIEGFERGAIIDGGGILVNVPSPARFGFHKLIVAGERGATVHTCEFGLKHPLNSDIITPETKSGGYNAKICIDGLH